MYTGPIRRDQQIVVEPGNDRISIDERPVYTDNLRREARHQIFFAPERRGGGERDDHDGIPADARRIAAAPATSPSTPLPPMAGSWSMTMKTIASFTAATSNAATAFRFFRNVIT